MTFCEKSLDSDLILCSHWVQIALGAAGHFVAGTLDMFYSVLTVCIVFYVITLCCHRDVLATTVQEAAGYAMAMKLPPCGGVTIFSIFS